jgi:hypothetical protein
MASVLLIEAGGLLRCFLAGWLEQEGVAVRALAPGEALGGPGAWPEETLAIVRVREPADRRWVARVLREAAALDLPVLTVLSGTSAELMRIARDGAARNVLWIPYTGLDLKRVVADMLRLDPGPGPTGPLPRD